MNIKVKYSSIDRFRETRTFKTLEGARKFAQHWIGKNPEMGSTYAVAGDGIGKITVEGAALKDLFGDEPGAKPRKIYVVTNLSRYFETREEAEAEIAALVREGYRHHYPIEEYDAEGLK